MFPGRDFSNRHSPICAYELVETLFPLQCDSCAWLPRMWLPPYARVCECQWLQNFPCAEIQLLTSASYARQCRTQFCRTATVLPSVTRPQNLCRILARMSTRGVLGQHKKIGGITFRTTLVLLMSDVTALPAKHLYCGFAKD